MYECPSNAGTNNCVHEIENGICYVLTSAAAQEHTCQLDRFRRIEHRIGIKANSEMTIRQLLFIWLSIRSCTIPTGIGITQTILRQFIWICVGWLWRCCMFWISRDSDRWSQTNAIFTFAIIFRKQTVIFPFVSKVTQLCPFRFKFWNHSSNGNVHQHLFTCNDSRILR